MHDPPHPCPLAGSKQRRNTVPVHASGKIARTVLEYAGTVHDRIDAAQVRQPLRRIDCARDVDRHLNRDQQVWTPTAPSGDTNHLVALGSKARCHGRSNQSIHPDDENAHLGLLREPRDALFQHWPLHFLVPHVGR